MSRYQIRIPNDSSEPPDHVVLPYISDKPKFCFKPSENHPSPQSNQASHDGKTIAGLHKELQILSNCKLQTKSRHLYFRVVRLSFMRSLAISEPRVLLLEEGKASIATYCVRRQDLPFSVIPPNVHPP
ncbi:hypothetical protein EDD18DRAFT_1117350 [Armillaria luteobubalina]|uniref:Uncharacterized protein n=1 Tax=Armillaria luteobubalina TaxID=153913 RepID=A0AA39NXJ2_9AGAR|nr:hypothetical protein EDD18DRAFT_1117350 [Armillaria luteobubalina]